MKKIAVLVIKAAILAALSLVLTVAARVYLFQSILSQRIIESAGRGLTVEDVGLGISNFSMNSVRMTNLSFASAGVVSARVGEVELDYDFVESMRNEARFNYIIIRRPEIRVESLKKLAGLLFSSRTASASGNAAGAGFFENGACALPAVNLSGGVLELGNPSAVFDDVRCDFSPLTDMNLYVRTTARLRDSNTRITLNWNVNFSDLSVRFGGALVCARIDFAERALIKFFGSDVLRSVSGESDIKFAGKYSYSTGAFELACAAAPRNCSIALAAPLAGSETAVLRTGEVSLFVSGDSTGVRDYGISSSGLEAFVRNKPVRLSVKIGPDARKITAEVPSVTIYDVEPLLGRAAIPDSIKKHLPDAMVSISADEKAIDIAASVSPSVYRIVPGVLEVSASGGTLRYRSRRGTVPPGLEIKSSLCVNGSPQFEFSASSSSASVLNFTLGGKGSGAVRRESPDGPVALSYEEKGDRKQGRLKVDASVSTDGSGKFFVRASGVNPEKLAGSFPGVKKNFFAGILRPGAGAFDATISGYSENERTIGSFTLTRGAASGLAGTFWIKDFLGQAEYGARAVAETSWVSSIADARFSRLLSFFRAADNSRLEFAFSGGATSGRSAELLAPFGKLSVAGGVAAFDVSLSDFAAVRGKYDLGYSTVEAGITLDPAKAPQVLGKFINFSGLSDFTVRSRGAEWFEVSGGKPESGAKTSFQFRIEGASWPRLFAVVEGGRLESKLVSADFSAKVNLSDFSFSSTGRLAPGIFKQFLPSLAALSDASVSFSTSGGPAAKFGDDGIAVKFSKKGFVLKGVDLDADFLVQKPADGGVRLSLKKLVVGSAASRDALFSMSGDAVLAQDGTPVSTDVAYSFKNDGITFYNIIKDNALPEIFSFKNPESLKKMGKFSCSGKISARGSVLVSHEFELSAARDSFAFSGVFRQAGSPVDFNSEIFNFRAGGSTYKSSCNLNLSGGHPRFRIAGDGMKLSDLIEFIFAEKTSFPGLADFGADILLENDAVKISADMDVRDSKIDIDRLMGIISKRKTPDFENHLDVRFNFSGMNYITTSTVQAAVDGSVSVSGPASNPAVSGKINILRGRLHYFNRPFNITSGYFSLSSMRNVASKVPAPSKRVSEKPSAASSFRFSISAEQLDMAQNSGKSIVDVYTSISAEDKISQYDIYLNLYGNRERMNSVLTSKPELSQDSIYMLLYGMSPGTSASQAANRFDDQITSDRVIGAINSQFQDAIYERIGSSLEKKLNLDEVRINPYTGVSKSLFGRKNESDQKNGIINMNSFSDVQIKIGKYVDPTLFLSYSKSLSYSRNDSIGMEYKIKNQFFVDGKVDQNLEYTVGAKYGISF